MSVYFIQQGKNGPIKIGTARNPHTRLRELQTANPERLYLLGAIEGGVEEERRLHSRFSAWRMAGEWFRADVWDEVARRVAQGVLAQARANGLRVVIEATKLRVYGCLPLGPQQKDLINVITAFRREIARILRDINTATDDDEPWIESPDND